MIKKLKQKAKVTKNFDDMMTYFESFSKKPRRTHKTNTAETSSDSYSESESDMSSDISDDSPKVNKHKSREYRDAVRKYEKYKKVMSNLEKN